MKPKYWLILGAMVSVAIVAAAFVVAYPPYTTVRYYDEGWECRLVWRVNNWTGTRKLLFVGDYKYQPADDSHTSGQNKNTLNNPFEGMDDVNLDELPDEPPDQFSGGK